ncbi:MAG: hypothetical protein ACE5ID_11140 [Acidobacteriota bacterium]
MKLSRQTVFLMVLLVVLIYVLYQSFGPASGRTQVARLKDESPLGDLGTMPPSILSYRDAEMNRPSPLSNGRNLFGFGVPKRAAVPPPKPPKARARKPIVRKPKEKTVVVKTPPPKASPVAAAPPLPTPPAINFVFLGYMGPEDGLIGVFNVTTPDGDEIVLAGVGDVIEEKFRVDRIGYEEVEIGYTLEAFGQQKKTLLMGGQS